MTPFSARMHIIAVGGSIFLIAGCAVHHSRHDWDGYDYQQDKTETVQAAHPDIDSDYTPPKNSNNCALMDFCE